PVASFPEVSEQKSQRKFFLQYPGIVDLRSHSKISVFASEAGKGRRDLVFRHLPLRVIHGSQVQQTLLDGSARTAFQRQYLTDLLTTGFGVLKVVADEGCQMRCFLFTGVDGETKGWFVPPLTKSRVV